MQARLAHAHWVLILIASVVIYLVTLILGIVVSFPLLAFLNAGHLDSSSAAQVSSLVTALLVILVTASGSLWVVRRVKRAALLHGVLVGLVVALLSLVLDWLFRGTLGLAGVVLYVLMVAAGALGGLLGSRMRAQS